MDTPRLTIYYDGLCPLCSREIAHYRRRARDTAGVEFLDITAPTFDAAAHGLDPVQIHRVMHVKAGGAVRTGVDAFIAIWDVMPGYGWLGRVARWPLVKPLLRVGYAAFAKIRPLLPRRAANCETGMCNR